MSRHHLFNAATLHEDTPGTIRTLLGRILPLDVPRAIAAPVEGVVTLATKHAEGCAEVRPSRRAAERLEPVSPHLTGAVWATLQRHPLRRTTFGAAGESGRLLELEKILAEVPCDRAISKEEAPFVIGHVAHLCVDLGLDVRAAEEPVMAWLAGRAPFGMQEVRAWMSKALEGGAFYPPDGRGAELDAEAAEREAQEAAHRAAIAEVEPDRPNTKTDGELGRFTIALPTSALLRRDGVPRFLHVQPPDPSAEYTFVSFDRAAFCGAPFRERFGTTIVSSDFVRADHLTSETKKKTIWPSAEVRAALLEYGRPGKRTKRADAAWDARTAEGRDREAQFDATCETMMSSVLAGSMGGVDWTALQMVASAGREGFGLAEDIIAHVMQRVAEEHWKARHVKPAGWDEHERARAKTARTLDGKGGSWPYEPKEWAPPSLPRPFVSEASVREAIAEAPAYFDADELYVRPAAGALDRIWSAMTSDPFRPIIEEAIAGKNIIRSSELEDELIRACQVQGELTPAQHTRVHRIMTSLGFKKTDRTVDGRRCKVFVRISSDKAAE
jgi:hypothetical protein